MFHIRRLDRWRFEIPKANGQGCQGPNDTTVDVGLGQRRMARRLPAAMATPELNDRYWFSRESREKGMYFVGKKCLTIQDD